MSLLLMLTGAGSAPSPPILPPSYASVLSGGTMRRPAVSERPGRILKCRAYGVLDDEQLSGHGAVRRFSPGEDEEMLLMLAQLTASRKF